MTIASAGATPAAARIVAANIAGSGLPMTSGAAPAASVMAATIVPAPGRKPVGVG